MEDKGITGYKNDQEYTKLLIEELEQWMLSVRHFRDERDAIQKAIDVLEPYTRL